MATKNEKKTKKIVKVAIDAKTSKKVRGALDKLGAPGLCLEKCVDDAKPVS
jgi:hypothetical protein